MLDERKQSYMKVVLLEIMLLIILYSTMLLHKISGHFDILVNIFKIISIIGFPSAFILSLYLMKSAKCWYSENKETATEKDRTYLLIIITIVIVLSIILVYSGIDTIKYCLDKTFLHHHDRVDGLIVQ